MQMETELDSILLRLSMQSYAHTILHVVFHADYSGIWQIDLLQRASQVAQWY